MARVFAQTQDCQNPESALAARPSALIAGTLLSSGRSRLQLGQAFSTVHRPEPASPSGHAAGSALSLLRFIRRWQLEATVVPRWLRCWRHVHVEGEGFGVGVVVPGIAFQSEGEYTKALFRAFIMRQVIGRKAIGSPHGIEQQALSAKAAAMDYAFQGSAHGHYACLS